jgi:hypothetical protein
MAENIPIESYTLPEFVEKTKLLQADHDDQARFITFALTGVDDEHQSVIDAVRNAVPEDHSLSVLRDYDSLLGLSADLAVDNFIYVYPVAKREDTLNTNIHVKHRLPGGKVNDGSMYLILNLTYLSVCSPPQNTQRNVRKVGRA